MNSTGLNFSSVQYPGFEKRLQYIDDNKNQTIRIINKNSINRNALVEAEIPFSSFVSASNLCTIKKTIEKPDSRQEGYVCHLSSFEMILRKCTSTPL